MRQDQLFKLYLREREHQRRVFGEYHTESPLNLASFLILHGEYTRKAKHLYVQQWDKRLPPWLLNTVEHAQQGSAPVRTYQEIIKNFALHGACLETFAQIDPDMWRRGEDIKRKWKVHNCKEDD